MSASREIEFMTPFCRSLYLKDCVSVFTIEWFSGPAGMSVYESLVHGSAYSLLCSTKTDHYRLAPSDVLCSKILRYQWRLLFPRFIKSQNWHEHLVLLQMRQPLLSLKLFSSTWQCDVHDRTRGGACYVGWTPWWWSSGMWMSCNAVKNNRPMEVQCTASKDHRVT